MSVPPTQHQLSIRPAWLSVPSTQQPLSIQSAHLSVPSAYHLRFIHTAFLCVPSAENYPFPCSPTCLCYRLNTYPYSSSPAYLPLPSTVPQLFIQTTCLIVHTPSCHLIIESAQLTPRSTGLYRSLFGTQAALNHKALKIYSCNTPTENQLKVSSPAHAPRRPPTGKESREVMCVPATDHPSSIRLAFLCVPTAGQLLSYQHAYLSLPTPEHPHPINQPERHCYRLTSGCLYWLPACLCQSATSSLN